MSQPLVVILSARTGWQTDQLSRALAGRGFRAVVERYEALQARFGGTPACASLAAGATRVLEAEAVFARIIPNGSLEQIIYRVNALHWLERRGIPVINSPRAIERAVDKFYATALLQEAGLPVPETVVCEDAGAALAAVQRMGDAIIKPMFGSMGHGMVRVGDPDLAFRVVRALAHVHSVFYVQRALAHQGRDIRVFVVGGRVLGAIERQGPPGDWRTNVSRGGTARPVDLPEAWADLARRAAAVIGADYAGVDLLPAADGQVFVLEVNGIPGWQGFQDATGIDVAEALVEHLVGRLGTAGTPAHGGPRP